MSLSYLPLEIQHEHSWRRHALKLIQSPGSVLNTVKPV